MCAKILESVYHWHCDQSKLQQHIATHNNVHENVYCIFVCICHSCLKWNFIHFAWTKFTVHTSLLRWTKIYLYVCVFFSTLSLTHTNQQQPQQHSKKCASSFEHDAMSRWRDIYSITYDAKTSHQIAHTIKTQHTT